MRPEHPHRPPVSLKDLASTIQPTTGYDECHRILALVARSLGPVEMRLLVPIVCRLADALIDSRADKVVPE